MTNWEKKFIAVQRVARLSTLDEDGHPHIVPIVYAFDGERIYTPIDEKPKRVESSRLQRVRNIQANNRVGMLVDIYDEDWQRLVWVQIRGQAAIQTEGDAYQTGIDLLMRKYPQYEEMPLQGRPLIVISPERIIGWQAT